MPQRRSPPPWSVEETEACFIVRDANGQARARRTQAPAPDAEAKTVALSKVDSWKRGEEFPKELVTLPGETYRNSALVTACYALLAPKSAALQ